MTYRLLLAVYVSLALWSDTAQSITLKSHTATTPACDPAVCGDYCEAKEKSVTGNGGDFKVVDINDEDWEGPPGGDKIITRELMCKFKKMQASVLSEEGGPRLKIVSGFRTSERQKHLWEKSDCTGEGSDIVCATGPFVAKPDTSDHGSGISLDIKVNCKKCRKDCREHDRPDPESECESEELTFLKEHAEKHNFHFTINNSPSHLTYRAPKATTVPASKASTSASGTAVIPTSKGASTPISGTAVIPTSKGASGTAVIPTTDRRSKGAKAEEEASSCKEVCPSFEVASWKRTNCEAFKAHKDHNTDAETARKRGCEEVGCCWNKHQGGAWCFEKRCEKDFRQ